MDPIDYGRAFFVTTQPGGEVRFAVESRTRITDECEGVAEEFLQAASCKSERSFVVEGIFREDNYDFLPVVGSHDVAIFRRKAWLNPEYRTLSDATVAIGPVQRHLPEPAFEELHDEEAVFKATLDFRPLVVQTEIWNDELELRAVIEYPVKTMNTVRASQYPLLAAAVDNPMEIAGNDSLYQTDTGPVAFPDLSQRFSRYVESLWLAFVAFNTQDEEEFIIEEPTPILEDGKQGPELGQTRHYSRSLRLPAKNRLFAMKL